MFLAKPLYTIGEMTALLNRGADRSTRRSAR